MCHFVATLDANLIKPLVSAGLHRGNSAFSHTRIALDTNSNLLPSTLSVEKNKESLTEERLTRIAVEAAKDPYVAYHIIHTQAPTGNFKDLTHGDSYGIHPAVEGSTYLWHNGLLRDVRDKWDTQHILHIINEDGWDGLSKLNGSFACILLKDGVLYAFRNHAAPLYFSGTTLSTEPFEGGYLMDAEVVRELNFFTEELMVKHFFTDIENPYYFTEDLE